MSIWKILLNTLNTIIIKLGSFKNSGAIGFSLLGMVVAQKLDAEFTDWSFYQLGVLAFFYGSNQLQKYLMMKNNADMSRQKPASDPSCGCQNEPHP